MKKENMMKLLICFLALCFCLYSYLDARNQMTRLCLQLPELSREVTALKEENLRLKYEIESFESPDHLLSLIKSDQFSHLKFPQMDQVLQVERGLALSQPVSERNSWEKQLYPTVVFGAK